MHLWWVEDPCVPEFINIFDDAQKKATCAYLPVTINWLAAMYTSAFLSANSLPNNRPSWDGFIPFTQTWTAWKLKFVPLHTAMEMELWASFQRGDSFGSAKPTMAAHRITAELTTHPTTIPARRQWYSSSHKSRHFALHFYMKKNNALCVTFFYLKFIVYYCYLTINTHTNRPTTLINKF